MPVHIDQLTTDVIPEPESAAAVTAVSEKPWEEEERARDLTRRLKQNAGRTSAKGFDD
jgi:hypothetical protein